MTKDDFIRELRGRWQQTEIIQELERLAINLAPPIAHTLPQGYLQLQDVTLVTDDGEIRVYAGNPDLGWLREYTVYDAKTVRRAYQTFFKKNKKH